MCGIIAVVRRRSTRTPPAPHEILDLLQPLGGVLRAEPLQVDLDQRVQRVADALAATNTLLSGVPGVRALLSSPDVRAAVQSHCLDIADALTIIDLELDSGRLALDAGQLERVNAELLRAKDLRWAVAEDRVRTAEAVGDLLNGTMSDSAVEAF